MVKTYGRPCSPWISSSLSQTKNKKNISHCSTAYDLPECHRTSNMEENSWLQEHIRGMNDKLTKLVGITATHSMAFKILGAGVVIIAGAICVLVVKWLEGKLG
ncbi:MAG: hypothetical protein U9P10_08145 [Thermodesulfobacteriota bacterium]|nr:hypothetical protein [Thermodesulfobacteriota bacterium]